VKYDQSKPLDSGYGLADFDAARKALAKAAADCKRIHGTLEVPWGDVYRIQRGKLDLPANGGSTRMGVFRTLRFVKEKEGRYHADHGETFVCAIEFSVPQRAQCLLGYGNASQPGSKHIEDQLPMMVQKKLHPVWRERKEIEANLERKDTF